MTAKITKERTPEQKIFHDGMYGLMQERYELQQGQRSRWNKIKTYCEHRYDRPIPDTEHVRHLCSNRGHIDFKRTGRGHNLKCAYKKCPYLKGTV